jgi:hypothetical protein
MSSDRDHGMQPPSSKRQRLQLATGGAVESIAGTSNGMMAATIIRDTTTTNTDSIKDIQNDNETNPLLACDDDEYSSSVESILGVPVEILFRQVGGSEGKERDTDRNKVTSRRQQRPLLTRPEVDKFLRVTLLAQEIDVLVDLAGTVLNRQRCVQRFRRDVLLQGKYQEEEGEEKEPNTTTDTIRNTAAPWKNPWLTTLGPILDVMEQNQPQQPIRRRQQQQHQVHIPIIERNHQNNNILHYIYNRMTQLSHELHYFCVSDLENSADQNRECFMHMIDCCEKQEEEDEDENECSSNRKKSSSSSSPVQILAQEKIALAELQDHLSKRIRSFLNIFCFPRDNNEHDGGNGSNNNNGGYIEMKDTTASSSLSSKIKLFAATTAATNSKQNNKESQLSSSFSTVVRTGGGDNISKSNNENDDDDDKKDPYGDSCGDDDEGNGDDDHSLLSLEEVMTPLKEFCEKLFAMENKNKIVNDQAGKELTMGNEQQQQHRKLNALSRTGSNESSSRSVIAGSATTDDSTMIFSQRSAGAAAVMLSLATKPNDDKHDTHHSYNNYNHNREVTTSIHQHQKEVQKVDGGYEINENPRKYSASDDSSIDDPPEDGNDTNKGEAISNNNCNENSKDNRSQVNDDVSRRVPRLGIFDVVDVLTPQSPSQQEQQHQQEKRNEINKFNSNNNTGNNNLRRHNYNEHNVSSLTSESQTVAAEALTRMIQGNHTYS